MKRSILLAVLLLGTVVLKAQEADAPAAGNPLFIDYVGGGIHYAPFGFGSSASSQFPSIGTSSGAFRLGGIVGKKVLEDGDNMGFVNAGLEFTIKSYTFDGNHRSHFAAVDADGDDYIRNVSINLKEEHWTSVGIDVPVTFMYLLNLLPEQPRKLYLTLEGGLYFGLRVSQSGSYSLNARYTGTYPQYFNVEMDHYYDYGNYALSDATVSPSGEMNTLDVGLTFGVGAWYRIDDHSSLRFDITLRKGFLGEAKYMSEYEITRAYNNYTPVLHTLGGLFEPYVGMTYVWFLQ